jgi:flagellar L-ring protein precursor FlgH
MCASPPIYVEKDMIPSYQRLQAETDYRQQGAIYQAGTDVSLYQDVKARRVGDILTVLLVEETSGQNSSDSNVNQSTAMSVLAPTFGGSTRPRMAIDLASENAFNGQSGSSQSNRLSGSVAVTVHEVLPNGNLVVEGEKRIRINQGNEYVRLEGVVRPRDIDAYNTLYSTQVADARISYGGKGTNARGNSPGWGAKILFSPLWPF